MSDSQATTVAPAARQWLFKAQRQVFGPIPEPRLVALIESGEVGPATEVAGDDGRWTALRDVPRFLVHLRRAEARARVESEATAVRRVARRRTVVRGAAIAAACALLVAVVGIGAFWFVARRVRTSALLADFGAGISISEVTVGAGAERSASDEIAVPDAPAATQGSASGSAPRAKRLATARPPAPRGTAEGGGLVLAQYDPRQIQEAVARQRASLAPCLREEAERSPEFAGDIPIEFAVGNDGRVAQLWVDEPRFKSGPLRDCLLRKLAAWTFEPFPGQRPVVSLAFTIGR
jgi:hypothetical protein